MVGFLKIKLWCFTQLEIFYLFFHLIAKNIYNEFFIYLEQMKI